MIDKKLLVAAIEAWGEDAQINMAIEECAELIVALSHARRGKLKSRYALLEEIADVKIMVAQLELIFGEGDVETITTDKMFRLAGTLQEL